MATDRDVERALEELQRHHRVGLESLEQHPRRIPYGTSNELLRRQRSLARRYTTRELEQLMSRARQYRRALHLTTVERLASIENKRERGRIEQQAISEGWSRIRLENELRQRFGVRQRHAAGRSQIQSHGRTPGRPPRRPRDVGEGLAWLSRLFNQVTRWVTMLQEDDEQTAGRTTWGDLPASVRTETERILIAIEKLQKTIEKELKKRRD